MKPNLIIRYMNGGQKRTANFCLDEWQMELLEDSEVHGNYWPNLVLHRYATNTSSRLHRRRINNILDDRSNSGFEYEKVKH